MDVNVRWQWENNPDSIRAAIRKHHLRLGLERWPSDPPNRHNWLDDLCYGQRHNPDVVNDYRTFPNEAFESVYRLYATEFYKTDRKGDARLPIGFGQAGHCGTLNCGGTLGALLGH